MYVKSVIDLLIVIAGTAVVGAILGMPEGAPVLLERAMITPLILVGVVLLMIPPLYIASALLQVAAPAPEFLQSTTHALRSSGLVLLGLAAPLAFLVVTSAHLTSVWLLGSGVVGLSALVGTRALYTGVFVDTAVPDPGRRRTSRPLVLFLLWLAMGGAIAEQLFLAALN